MGGPTPIVTQNPHAIVLPHIRLAPQAVVMLHCGCEYARKVKAFKTEKKLFGKGCIMKKKLARNQELDSTLALRGDMATSLANTTSVLKDNTPPPKGAPKGTTKGSAKGKGKAGPSPSRMQKTAGTKATPASRPAKPTSGAASMSKKPPGRVKATGAH